MAQQLGAARTRLQRKRKQFFPYRDLPEGRPVDIGHVIWWESDLGGAPRRMGRPHYLSRRDAEVDRSPTPLDAIRSQQLSCPHGHGLDELAFSPAKVLVCCPDCHGVLRKFDGMRIRTLS